jgi:hypothetical protein
MKTLLLGELAQVFENIGDNAVHIRRGAKIKLHGTPLWSAVQSNLGAAVTYCSQLGTMPQSLIYAERMLHLSETTFDDKEDTETIERRSNYTIEFANKLDILLERMRDELNGTICFVVPVDRARYFTSTEPFGPEVAQLFPRSIIDTEEAAKCLGSSRATACVFHLMRVMEDGLKTVATVLDIPYAPSWESYIKQIETKLDLPWKSKSRTWRKEEPFFRDVLAHLHAVKVAWRNPTMHIVNHYTPEQAEDVFNAVRGFMRHLAGKLEVGPGHRPRIIIV